MSLFYHRSRLINPKLQAHSQLGKLGLCFVDSVWSGGPPYTVRGGVLTRDNPESHRFRPKEVVDQFTLSLRRELDVAHECRNATRIAGKLTKD